MLLREAYELLNKKKPNLKVLSCVDYNEYFVFNTESSEHSEDNGPWLGGLLAVNKKTKEVFGFNPMKFNPSEYFKAAETNKIKF